MSVADGDKSQRVADLMSSVKHHALLYVNNEPPPINEHSSDVTYVKESMPDGVYKIKPLRDIITSGNLRPQFGDMRVFVFNGFDSMSEICQNALLKFIEEPHEYNRFVMIANTTAKILPTILSRVVVIRGSEDKNQSMDSVSEGIAKEIQNSASEYDMLVAFNKIKDRQGLGEVLQLLLSPNNVQEADVLYKYIKRLEVNLNISMTTAACTAELYINLFPKLNNYKNM